MAVNPAIALTSVAAAKVFLRLGDAALSAEEVAELERQIDDASAWMATRAGRDFLRRSYVDRVDGRGGASLYLEGSPVSAVSGVKVDGATIPPAPAEGDDGWWLVAPDLLVLTGYTFREGFRNVEVSYTAGWLLAELPADVVGAVLQLVALRWKEGERAGVVSQSVGGGSASWAGSAAFANVSGVAASYRRARV